MNTGNTYMAIAWISFHPYMQMETPTAAHGVPDPVLARTKYSGRTFCGKAIKARGQTVEPEITCRACLRSKTFRALSLPLQLPLEPSNLWGHSGEVSEAEAGF